MPNLLIALAGLQLALASGHMPQVNPKGDDSSIIKNITDAYIFGIPIVLEDLTRRKLIDGANPRHGFISTFTHLPFFPDASFRLVVRPNAGYKEAVLYDADDGCLYECFCLAR